MDFTGEIAKQGLGYVLFVLACGVIAYLFREIRRINDQRIEDLNKYKEIFVTTAKDLLNAVQNQTKAIDTSSELLNEISHGLSTNTQLLNELLRRK